MKNKFKKITTILCLLIIGVTCITGCSATGDITLPTDYDVTTNGNITLPTDYNVTTTITEKTQYRLTVINDSENGTIFPNLNNETSSVMVDEGDSYTFTIKAKEGYEVQNLLIDGELVDAQEIYTFSNINENHSIGAIYSEKPKAIKSLTLIGLEYDSIIYSAEEQEYSFVIYHDKRISDDILNSNMENDLPLLYHSETLVAKNTKASSGYISIPQESIVEIELNNNDSFKLRFEDSGGFGGAILTLSIKDFICIENNYYTVYKVNYNKQSIGLENGAVLISDLTLYFIANY